jgi:hypothetical protein
MVADVEIRLIRLQIFIAAAGYLHDRFFYDVFHYPIDDNFALELVDGFDPAEPAPQVDPYQTIHQRLEERGASGKQHTPNAGNEPFVVADPL